MVMRRNLLATALACCMVLIGGCVADDVVYVDEQGNELAVDAQGRPVTGEQAPLAPAAPMGLAPVPVERAPRVASPVRQRSVPSAPRPPAAAASAAPSPDPSWDLDSANGGSGAAAATPTPSPVQPARKVGTSGDLDRPPAG